MKSRRETTLALTGKPRKASSNDAAVVSPHAALGCRVVPWSVVVAALRGKATNWRAFCE